MINKKNLKLVMAVVLVGAVILLFLCVGTWGLLHVGLLRFVLSGG